ncbi:cell division ATP-binding protein FtsE [Magnetococcus sp. PR-3]|uniref:cell division ATP-binding protein FtsE n=1 Tax=Magnetococcus sp. PR-3 TaxID=3120355 RepID=UPI002FCDE35D
MVRFHNVSLRYATGFEALHNISFQVKPGQFVFLTGHSGAGKTSILKLIYQAEMPSEGTILLNGRNVERLASKQLPALRRGIGVIFQDYKLLYDRTVYENVALAMEVAGQPVDKIEPQVERTLEYVGLKERMFHNPIALSGGEQQRVAIARAIVNRPPVVIADEPTGNLDKAMGQRILGLFQSLHQQGTTIIVVTHDVEMAQDMGHPIIVMEDGRILTTLEGRS